MLANLEYYKTFYYAAKFNSFSKAAEVLYLTQSAVSQSIHRLESQLGTVLFRRVAHRMLLTPEGEVLYRHVALAFSTLQAGESQLSRLLALEEGELTIGATETGLIHCVLPKLLQFKQRFPNINVIIKGTHSKELLDLLRSGNVDLAIGVTPIANHKTLSIKLMQPFHDVFFASDAFASLRDKMISPEELVEYPLVIASAESSASQNLSEFFAQQECSFNPQIRVMTTTFVLPFVQQGLAVGCAPEMFVKQWLRKRTLFPIKLTISPPARQLFLATNGEIPLSNAAKEFIQLVL